MNRLRRWLLHRRARRLRRTLKAKPEVRRELEAEGIFFLPRDFYASVPRLDEIEDSFEYREGAPPWLDEDVFDAKRIRRFFETVSAFADELEAPDSGDPEEPRFFWDNAMFPPDDALLSYCILRHLSPRRLVEVGSGFSTLVAQEALDRNGEGEITCVDPYPRAFLNDLSRVGEVVARPVQELPVGFFSETLAAGDVLFLDSTHTVKTGSDCLHLYLNVIPRLAPGVVVHAHDIFLPFGMPRDWQVQKGWYFTEQYLLLALLIGNRNLRVLSGSQLLGHLAPDLVERAFGGRGARIGDGGSFWFERV